MNITWFKVYSTDILAILNRHYFVLLMQLHLLWSFSILLAGNQLVVWWRNYGSWWWLLLWRHHDPGCTTSAKLYWDSMLLVLWLSFRQPLGVHVQHDRHIIHNRLTSHWKGIHDTLSILCWYSHRSIDHKFRRCLWRTLPDWPFRSHHVSPLP